MNDNTLKDKYFVKIGQSNDYTDITTLVDGARILKVDGFLSKGKPINIYTAQWINEQTEDFIIADENNNVVYENPDIEITFIISKRYATNKIGFNEVTQHTRLVDTLMGSDLWIWSKYVDKEVHCIPIDAYKPTTAKIKRGNNSYIIGTIKLHMIDKPRNKS